MELLTPRKKRKSDVLISGDTFSTFISSIHQPIEVFFNWLNRLTNIKSACLVCRKIRFRFERLANGPPIRSLTNRNHRPKRVPEVTVFYFADLFDFNVVIANLNKMDKAKAMGLVAQLRSNIAASAKVNKEYAIKYADIPLVGRTIFDQQQLLYNALLEWLDTFEREFGAD